MRVSRLCSSSSASRERSLNRVESVVVAVVFIRDGASTARRACRVVAVICHKLWRNLTRAVGIDGLHHTLVLNVEESESNILWDKYIRAQ